MALKRSACGNDPAGIDATLNGELMVECPACPHPGRNLPDGWERAGPLLYVHLLDICTWKLTSQLRFLYTLYVAIDGNFKLKGKQRNLKDVELMPGWGAFVPEKEYKTHIANHVDEEEVSTLSATEYHKSNECINRLIHASPSMTLWFVRVLAQCRVMQSQVPF